MAEIRANVNSYEREAIEAAQQIHQELSDLNPNIEMDAKEFGRHLRGGGWEMGLMVARSVQPGEFGRGRSTVPDEMPDGAKVSIGAFSHISGVSHVTVAKYLNAWNAAAAHGLVPPSSALQPGATVELPAPSLWKAFYASPKTRPAKNAFIRYQSKLDAMFAEDFDAALAEYGSQFDVSLDNLLESLARLKRKMAEGEAQVVELARKHDFRVEFHADGSAHE